MKGVAWFAAALVLFVVWLKVKDAEKSRVRDAVFRHVEDVCADFPECHVRAREGFEPCFNFAYFGGFLPGSGTIDLREFARCFNYNRVSFELKVTPGEKKPPLFPTR